jgi:ribonuclease G
VRQLRLRDIGGIIVIDFIDMASPKNRAAVEKALGEELERDRTKTYVVEISPLGLVEMTRQNVTDGPREVMTKKCPTCGGDGIVISEHTAAVDVERRLRGLVTPGSRSKAFRVEVSAKVAWLVAGAGGSRLRELEETTKRRFFLVGKEGEHLDHFKVLDQGTLENLAPKVPVDVGQDVEIKLGEVGLHDPHAGVGKLDDIDVVVGDAAKLVGKKVTARVTALADGLVWAELLTPAEEVDEPLTAEGEAERPTRVKKTAAPKKTTEVDPDEPEGEAEVEEEEGDEVAEDDGDSTTPAKKKTRRGSRGGRNRKKKTATAAATGAIAEAVSDSEVPDTAEPDETEAVPAPVIHLPDRELTDEDGDAPTPAKKRTRRGSRGGRNRRKKTATATTATVEAPVAETEVVEHAEEAAEEPPENGDWGYTPMSQWGMDDDAA